MSATYYLTVLPETSKLVPGIRSAMKGAEKDLTLQPKLDTRGAAEAGRRAGREMQDGIERSARGGTGIGRFLRADGARSVGQQAGSEINAGLQSADVGRGLGSQLASNLTSGAMNLGRNVGSMIATGLKATAVVGGTVAAAGIAGALHAGISRLTAIDDAKFKLQGLGNSAEQVQSIMDNALVAVKGTAFGLDEAATTAASAVAAGIKPGEQLTGYLKLVGDTAAIAGTSLADMGSIFNKVQTSGKAFTGDLNMLSDRGLPVFQWLQEEYGVTGEALSKMVSEGKVDAATFQKVVAERIGGAAQNMGGSIRGQLSNLKAAYSRFGAELAGPIFAAVSPLTLAFTGAFDKITTAIKPYTAQLTAIIGPWATDLGNKITAWLDNGGIQNAIDWMGRLVDRVQALRTSDGRSDALASISDSVQQIGPALAAAGEAMGAFGQAILAVGPETLSSVLAPALNILAGALKFVADNASWAVPVIGGLAAAFLAVRAATAAAAPFMQAYTATFNLIRSPIILLQAQAQRQLAAAMTQHTAALVANTGAQTVNTGAQTVNTATTVRGRIAAMASAVASRAAAAAQWLWNAALTANPIGLVIAAVVAAGVALWAFFTKTETGRKLWDKIWTGIKTTALTVWEWLKSTLGKAWETLQPGLSKLGAIAREAFSAIGNAVKSVWTFIQPAVEWLGRLQMSIMKLQFNAAVTALKALGSVIGWLWSNVVVPAFGGIVSAIETFWNVTKVIWDAATTAIGWVGDKVVWLWQNVTVPAFEAIKGAAEKWWTGVKVVWDLFTGALDKIGTGVGVFKDGIVNAFNAVKDVVTSVWSAIGGIWDKIVGGIGTVTDALRGAGGTVLRAFGLDGGAMGGVVSGGLPGYANGGRISGPGTGTSDSILGFPAMVRVANGEFITNARTTAQYLPLLQALNAGMPLAEVIAKLLPRFAEGGMVSADQLVDFARGVEGQPYVWGGTNWGDCSGAVSAIANYATGLPPFGSRFSTASEADELAKRGFKPGLGPAGSLQIGWYNGGPGGGHTAATLPDGTNFEMGGARGNGQFGGSAAGASDPEFTNRMHLPPEWFTGLDGGAPTIGSSTSARGAGTYTAATSSQLSASSRKVDSARTAMKNANQAVDDRTYARDKAQQRLDEAKAKGKGVDDAQHKLDVANRELADAQERAAKQRDKLTEAEAADEELRTKGKFKEGSSSSSGDGLSGADFGKTFVSGVLESIGLDGSLFSNPLEWPTVKSLMAGVNYAGGLLANGTGAATSPGGFADGVGQAVGLDGLMSALPGAVGDPAAGWTPQSGSPALAPGQFNPAIAGGGPSIAEGVANAMSAFAPDTTQHGQGGGAAPGPTGDVNFNGPVGMDPQALRTEFRTELNARSRYSGSSNTK
ncbi:tape measure protein [Mycobacterium phage Kashi_VT1]|nr:tape measure protein [Mycobacterium phage Kashi_VT1]